MSEEKLKSLVNQFPAYSEIFKAVYNWFIAHPKSKDVSIDMFCEFKKRFQREEISIAFTLMKQNLLLQSVYRVIDEDGTRMGDGFYSYDDIPQYIDDSWGHKKHIDDLYIVPFYSLNL